jgi:hypothetical protein
MNRYELVGMTIQNMIDRFKTSPESFTFCDSQSKHNRCVYPTIVWQPRIQLSDNSAAVMDPNNNSAVVIVFNTFANDLSCYVFLKAPINPTTWVPHMADSVAVSDRWFEKLRGNYRKFKKLRNLVRVRDRNMENLLYLNKLSSVFPDTLDSHLLDK